MTAELYGGSEAGLRVEKGSYVTEFLYTEILLPQ